MLMKMIQIPMLISIAILLSACNNTIPGTYDGPGREIRGKILDSTTQQPIYDAHIDADGYQISKDGDLYIPKHTLKKIIAVGDGPWGSHRTFRVSKKGYVPMLCVVDLRHSYVFGVVHLAPNGTKVEGALKEIGIGISCIQDIDRG